MQIHRACVRVNELREQIKLNSTVVLSIVVLHELLINCLCIIFIFVESAGTKKQSQQANISHRQLVNASSVYTFNSTLVSLANSAPNWFKASSPFSWSSLLLVALLVRWCLIGVSCLRASGRVASGSGGIMSLYRQDTLMRRFVKTSLEKNKVLWWSNWPVIVSLVSSHLNSCQLLFVGVEKS